MPTLTGELESLFKQMLRPGVSLSAAFLFKNECPRLLYTRRWGEMTELQVRRNLQSYASQGDVKVPHAPIEARVNKTKAPNRYSARLLTTVIIVGLPPPPPGPT